MEPDESQTFAGGATPEARKILQMYALMDQAMTSKGGRLPHKSSRRGQAADRLKVMIQELVAENLDNR
jgi:hypothetical protein